MNTASIAGLVSMGDEGLGAYVASKYGVVGLSEVLRSLSVYTDGENVTLTWQNDSVRGRASHCPRARARARRRRLLSCPERPQDLRANPAQ